MATASVSEAITATYSLPIRSSAEQPSARASRRRIPIVQYRVLPIFSDLATSRCIAKTYDFRISPDFLPDGHPDVSRAENQP